MDYEDDPEWQRQLRAENPTAPDDNLSDYRALYRELERPLPVGPPPALVETLSIRLDQEARQRHFKRRIRPIVLVLGIVLGALLSYPALYASTVRFIDLFIAIPWLLVMVAFASVGGGVFITQKVLATQIDKS